MGSKKERRIVQIVVSGNVKDAKCYSSVSRLLDDFPVFWKDRGKIRYGLRKHRFYDMGNNSIIRFEINPVKKEEKEDGES